MLVIPAVDIMDGKCVRLVEGDPSKFRVYYENPLDAAEKWVMEGAKLIHVVDLDAALGKGENTEMVKKIAQNIPVRVQFGGGLRTFEKAVELLKSGVFRVVFGTNLLLNPQVILKTVENFGSQRVAVSLDLKDDKIMLGGWKESVKADFLEIAGFAEKALNVGMIIFTSVNRDGTLKGPHIQHAKDLLRVVKIPVVASGGISSLSDLMQLSRVGVYGVIVGTALYEGKFSLKEAAEAVENVS
ncbi:MAG: 1-(5-phosphoribosyl)-5-[(5-phosphoribosylamino)methylideneamino]imidazole-4-carboxamide isomerase [Candidatus Bathyarchaeia archaeon]